MENKTFVIENLLFAKASTKSFLYMPLNMNKVMSDSMNKIDTAWAQLNDDYLILSKDISPWRTEHYFLIDHEFDGMDMVRLSGKFMARVKDALFISNHDNARSAGFFMRDTQKQKMALPYIFLRQEIILYTMEKR